MNRAMVCLCVPTTTIWFLYTVLPRREFDIIFCFEPNILQEADSQVRVRQLLR